MVLIKNLVALTLYDPLGWRYRVMQNGNVRSRRLPNSSYGYAWSCHHCKHVLPLDKDAVYEHIKGCRATYCLCKMDDKPTLEISGASTLTKEKKLFSLSEYQSM